MWISIENRKIASVWEKGNNEDEGRHLNKKEVLIRQSRDNIWIKEKAQPRESQPSLMSIYHTQIYASAGSQILEGELTMMESGGHFCYTFSINWFDFFHHQIHSLINKEW